jgi:hypothetical protein
MYGRAECMGHGWCLPNRLALSQHMVKQGRCRCSVQQRACLIDQAVYAYMYILCCSPTSVQCVGRLCSCQCCRHMEAGRSLAPACYSQHLLAQVTLLCLLLRAFAGALRAVVHGCTSFSLGCKWWGACCILCLGWRSLASMV